MFEQDAWWDKLYDACALQGARRKKQCIRHDVEEIRLWPDVRCRHVHHPQEWTPQVREDGRTWYPSKEDAEYTVCLVFHIVYSVSVWACRVGKAKLSIPGNLRWKERVTEEDGSSWTPGPLGIGQ